jgi:hypothetical protein
MGEPMKPTQEQIEHVKVWLDARLSALFAARPFPPISFSIESEMRDGVDFGAIFQAYGFTADGFGLLPDFYEIHKRKSNHCPTPR